MKINEQIGLKESEFNDMIEIISSYPNIEEAIIYGSRAKGNFRPFSDIDLTLKGERLTQNDLFRISDSFEESSLPYLFDISDFKAIRNYALKDHINHCGIRIYPL